MEVPDGGSCWRNFECLLEFRAPFSFHLPRFVYSCSGRLGVLECSMQNLSAVDGLGAVDVLCVVDVLGAVDGSWIGFCSIKGRGTEFSAKNMS